MKKKISLDLLAYIVIPIVLCNLFDNKHLLYGVIISVIIAIIDWIVSIKNINKINVSASIFFITYMIVNLLKINIKSSFYIYVYDTGFLVLFATVIIIVNFLGKNIVREIYRDTLKSNGYNRLYIETMIKKSGLEIEFNKLSNLILINILLLSFVKVYSIGVYGSKLFPKTSDLEMLISILFIIGEIYLLYLIISKTKIKTILYEKKNRRKKCRDRNDQKRIISLDAYREINK